ADDLRGHAHPCHAFAKKLDMSLNPIGCGIDAAAHVQPLDDDRAAELLRVRRPEGDDARLVGRRLAHRDRPPAVRTYRCTGDIRARRARDEVLGLLVADLGEVERRRGDERGPGGRDRALDPRARDLGARTGCERDDADTHARGGEARPLPERIPHRGSVSREATNGQPRDGRSSCPTTYLSTAKRRHSPGTPLSTWAPRAAKFSPEPATRSLTVDETMTSPGAAVSMTRAARWTAIPPMSSPRCSTSPAWSPDRTSIPISRMLRVIASPQRTALAGPSTD